MPSASGRGPRVLFLTHEPHASLSGGGRSLLLTLRAMRNVEAVIIGGHADLAAESQAGTDDRPADWIADRRAFLALVDGKASDTVAGRVRTLWAMLKSNTTAWRNARENGYDLAHCNSIFDFLFFGIGLAFAGVPVVLNIRGILHQRRFSLPWWAAFGLSRRIVVLSEAVREDYLRLMPRFLAERIAPKVSFIYNGLDMDDQARGEMEASREASRDLLDIPPGGLVLVYVAEFRTYKGQLEFITGTLPHLAHLQERHDLHLYFVGGVAPGAEAYHEECIRQATRVWEPGRVHFAGPQRRTLPWYRAGEITVLGSRFEGLPRVMLESLACGRPFACSAFPAAAEVLERYACGVIAPEGDYAGLARHIEALADDPGRREAMGERGREAARRLFDIDAVARNYETLYARILENKDACA